MSATIVHKLQLLVERYFLPSKLTYSSDNIKLEDSNLFSFSLSSSESFTVPGPRTSLGNGTRTKVGCWTSMFINYVASRSNNVNPKDFWNWLYLNEGKNNLSEEDLLSAINDEILCDGTLYYEKISYLNDHPFIIRNNLIFTLSPWMYPARNINEKFFFNVASTSRLRYPLVTCPGERSKRIATW